MGAIFGIVAQAFLAIVIIGYVLPWLGIEMLDTARQVADFHLPELVWGSRIILSIMVIPFIAAVMRDVFDVVPALLKESAYGLGATTWEVVWKVVLPYTKVGVIGGIMLGLGRALGETMAVTFVIGNAHQLSKSLMAPGNSIASALANEFTEAVGDQYFSALIELGLILFLITTVVLALAKLLLLRLTLREGALT